MAKLKAALIGNLEHESAERKKKKLMGKNRQNINLNKFHSCLWKPHHLTILLAWWLAEHVSMNQRECVCVCERERER